MTLSWNTRHRSPGRDCSAALYGLILLLAIPSAAGAQQAGDYFKQNCVACHTIGGGRLVGPDLKDATQRKDRAWLTKFLLNPKAVIDAGDAYALQLQQEAHGVVMPTLPGMTPARAGELLDLLEAESKQATPAAAGAAVSDKPFTPQDVALGRDLFLGIRPLAGRGPACGSCHTLGTLGGLGGGLLGPDLTRVYERLGGRKAVSAWLGAPATPTMQSVFRNKPLKPEEVLSLLAAIEDAAPRAPAPAGPSAGFLLLGFGGMALGLVGLQVSWRRRFRAVRRPLVRGRKRGER
ncbi:MAG TPA: cytochrome c [Candidatus Acidoferrum sp.]|nr:cytochrome c [Candidatus Acidoferrum sp.]